MEIDLELYKIFYYVCKLKNISKAAEILCVTQPAISRQISKLEIELNKKLIIRTNRGIELTSDGQEIYEKIKKPIEAIMLVCERCKEQKEEYDANIKIASGRTFTKMCLMDVIVNFNKIHPKVKFQIINANEVEEMKLLKSGDLDLIFYNESETIQVYPEIEIKKFMELHDIFVINNEIKEKYPAKIKLKDLNNYDVISTNKLYITRKFIDKYFKSIGQEFKPKYEVHNDEFMLKYIKNNMGIGITTEEFIKEELKKGEFVKIEVDKPFEKRQINYAIRKSDQYNKVIMDFIKEMKKNKKNN